MSLYKESNQFRAELEQQVENVDIREITQLPNFKNWFNSKKAHSKCYDYDLPKLFYRTLNSIDNLDNIVNGNEQSRFVGEYFTDDLDTALTYVEHLENSKVLIGFLNIQNPAIIDCKGAGWNEIRQNATVTEQLAYFEYLGFNEKPDNFEENRAYPIDLRNDEKDEGISFFLQIKTINKDTTPSFIKITAPQYYQNDRSFRKTKFINLDMLGYGTPSLFNDIGTTNFWATNLAHRHRFDSVIFENLNDDGGRGVTLFEKSVKKRKMHGTVVCAFDRENSYFKHANNHGDFNPDDRRIFYSLFDIEQDFKQEIKTEKELKTMENQQQTSLSGSLNDTPYSINERQAWNEFFDDRDNRAFTARWNMQRILPEQLGDAAYQHLSVETLRQAYIEHPDVFDKINEDAKVSGFYISDENKVVLIADAFIGREQTAVFTAWHELAHRGIAVQGRELWDDWLQTARTNDTVKEIADRIQIVYEHQGIQLNDLQATEEAVAEIFAAYKTQEWETLEQRHQIELSHEFKKPLGTAARLWHSAKNRIGKIFGVSQENRQPEKPKITDEQLFAMLGKLEQSIYQQPEFAVHERLAMGEAFTNYYDLNNQWKQLDLFETLTTTDFANGIDENNPTVIVSEQSERGNLLTTESETPTTSNLNNQEIATTATQSRNDGIRPTISKEEKEHLNEVKKSLQAAKKELKSLRKEFENKQGYSYFNTVDAELAIIRKQREILETQSQYENLLVEQKTKTGELSDLEKDIYAARAMAYVPYDKIDQAKDLIEQSLRARADIVEKFFKTEWRKVGDEIKALQQRIDSKDVYEFEIQAAMQDALAYFTPTKVNGLTLYHKGEVLPLATDRDKAVAWLLKEVMIDQKNQLIDKQNGLRRKINSIYPLVIQNDYKEKLSERAFKSRNRLETLENQIVNNMIDLRVERNLTYDINTPHGEAKVRELFYGSQHDEQQAELFERVFAMAQKLNVEVRHALRNENSFSNEDTRAVLGRYYFDSNSARVKHNGYIKTEEKGEVLLHELIHSVTSRAMFLKEQGRTNLLNAPQIQAIEDIEKIYKLVVEKAEALGLGKWQKDTGDYGLKNSHEMIAELANPVFRDKLKQIGVFDDTVAKITEISTGVGQAETVYDRLQKALYQLMDNYDPDFGEKYDRAKIRNIQMFDIKEENHMQEELLNQLDSQDASIRRGAASSEYADEAVLRKAFDDKHWQVREDAMRNTRATPELLHEWYQDADPYDKAIILDNPRIGNKTLIDALSDDNDLRYQALYRADKDANREVLHIAEQNSNPEIAKLASQYVSFYEPKIGNKKDPTWLDANLIREDWEHTLNSFNSMQALNETLTVESNLNQEDLVQLANLHQTKPELREKIENLLNESQLHQAINNLKQGQYDQFRLPETAFGVSQKDTVIASEQSERGNLLNTEKDPLVLGNGKFTQYAFETKVQDILRKDFAELIELSKQPENPELVQKQEEVFNLLQSIHHFEKQDLRAMAAVKEVNNPLITQLIERAISEPYPHNDWNRQEILSGSLNNPENQNPTVIASEQSERGNPPTTENETQTTAQSEVTALSSGFFMPENIQNTEFGKQAASVWQSTADNPRKIENTADERSKDILSKHNTYIEALKTDLKDLIETGDFYKASERLGDIRLNQQVFDERIQKAERQNSLPEHNPTADKGGIVSSTENDVATEIDDEIER